MTAAGRAADEIVWLTNAEMQADAEFNSGIPANMNNFFAQSLS